MCCLGREGGRGGGGGRRRGGVIKGCNSSTAHV